MRSPSCSLVLLAAAGALTATGGGVWFGASLPPGVEVELLWLAGPQGRLAARLWHPRGEPEAAVLLCHGVETNKEVMGTLGAELAARGVLALAFDYGGYGESDRHGDALEDMVADSAAALAALAARAPGKPLAVAGHSMGATYAVELARREPALQAAIALGNVPAAAGVPPRNVLYGVGAYDAFHRLADMLAAVREAAADPTLGPDATAGRFADGSARRLATSTLADHGIEPLDSRLIAGVVAWLAAAMPAARLDVASPVREGGRARAYLLAFAGLAAALLALFLRLFAGPGDPWRKRAHLGGFGLLLAGGSLLPWPLAPVWADAALAVLASGAVAAGLLAAGPRDPLPPHEATAAGQLARARRRLGRALLFSAFTAGCLLAGVLTGGLGDATRLGGLGELPRFLFDILLLRPYEGLCMLRGYAFHRYSERVVPGVGLAVLAAVELARPGLAATLVARAVAVLLRAVRFDGAFRLHTSRRSLALLALAGAALAYVLWRRFREGWLDSEALVRMASISLTALLLPLALFILGVNWHHRRRPPPDC